MSPYNANRYDLSNRGSMLKSYLREHDESKEADKKKYTNTLVNDKAVK